MSHRPWPLLKRVTQLLREGFQPWVKSGGKEVWARARRKGGHGPYEVEEAGPVTPAESELVSDIMHNRVLRDRPRSLP